MRLSPAGLKMNEIAIQQAGEPKAQHQSDFSPLIFLASLGAGGISVIPFAFLQYTTPNVKGLVQRANFNFTEMTGSELALHYSLDAIMLLFVTLHLLLTIFNTLMEFLSRTVIYTIH